MSNGGWIKIYRGMENWQWWHDEKMVKFFIYIILRANSKDSYVGQTLVPRGSFITSYQKMAEQCGFSVKQVRGMVDKLISTNEVTKSSTPKYTMITVKKYDLYQSEGKVEGKQRASKTANEGQTKGNKQEYKKNTTYSIKKNKEGADAQTSLSGEKDNQPEWMKRGFENEADYIRYLCE